MSPEAPALSAALEGTPFQGRVECHERLPSTIDRCREIAEAGAPEGAVVIAGEQAAGRGQPGHSWHSPPGGLHLSVLLRPDLPAGETALLAPLAGLAACEALRSLGVPARIKLPNDLVVIRDGAWRKLGGLLVDTAIQGDRLRHAIVSAGINVRVAIGSLPEPLRDLAASCDEVSLHPPSLEQVAEAFLREIAALAAGVTSSMVPPGASFGASSGVSPDGTARRDLLARHAAHVRDVRPGDAARDPS